MRKGANGGFVYQGWALNRLRIESDELLPWVGGYLMLCETCRWTGRPGFVQVRRNAQDEEGCEMIPCPDCGGQGIAHCCDGICEQRVLYEDAS